MTENIDAKNFHLFFDTISSNKETRHYSESLKRSWNFLKKELKDKLLYPNKVSQEDSNLILVWSNPRFYSEIVITPLGENSSFFKFRQDDIMYESKKLSSLPDLHWIDLMKTYYK